MKKTLFFLAMLVSVAITNFSCTPEEQVKTSTEIQTDGEEDRPDRDPDGD